MGTRLIKELLLFVSVLLASSLLGSFARAQALPPGALKYGPVLASVQTERWPEAAEPWTLAGLVEQESCISLRHSRCWNPRAELKTAREYGFGFGQVTVAYRANGSERFNKFEELKAAHPSLRDWEWADRYRADYQLSAVVLDVRTLWKRLDFVPSERERWAFVLSSYNGGIGHALQDRTLCARKKGCDPSRWFGHVELNSVKSRVPMAGYGGQSPYSINRKYPPTVLDVRRPKYQELWKGT